MDSYQFLKSKGITALLSVLLVVALLTTSKVLIQKYQIDKAIQNLSAQAANLNQQNQQLSELIKYFGTPGYKELQAREKLNLKKEGEFVVGLPQNTDGEVAGQTSISSNPHKWFDYFFAKAK